MQPSTADFQFDRAGRHLTVYLSGDLDASNAKAMASAVLDHTNPDDERVWIDMSTTHFCDSTGFAQLVRLHHHVDQGGGRLVIYNPTAPVQRVIDLCDPEHVLAVRTG